MGFSAYAVTRSAGDDPLGMALNRLIDHVAEQDKRIDALQEQLRRALGPDGLRGVTADELDRVVD